MKMYRMFIRPAVSALLLFSVLLCFSLNAFASSSVIADDSTARTPAYGLFPSYGFNSQITNERQHDGSSSYQSAGGTYYFSYDIPIDFTGTIHVNVYAYLWSGTFDTTDAQYYCDVVAPSTGFPTRGEVGLGFDQHSAPTGWNLVGSATFTDYYDFYGVSVGTGSSGNTGADAIMITYWIE